MEINFEQSAFNKVVRGVIKQGALAFSDAEGCQYRTESGLKCAIGQLIPDSKYTPALENLVILGLTRKSGLQRLGRLSVNFLQELQKAHDLAAWSDFDKTKKGNSKNIVGFVRNAQEVANRYGLTMPKEASDYLAQQG